MVNLLIKHLHVFRVFTVLCMFYNPTDSGAVELNEQNYNQVVGAHELVLINFYADWCRFSNLLRPIFDEAADAIVKEYPDGQARLAKVDCDKQPSIQSRFHITKYPTIKIIRNGISAKREYRGQRSVEAFSNFVKKQLEDPIKEFKDLSELEKLESNKRNVIGYFENRNQSEYQLYRRVATHLYNHNCQFYAGFDDASRHMHPPGTAIIVARPEKDASLDQEQVYAFEMATFEKLHKWIQDMCVPLIREITFENAEELTEEGLPFLILFHKADDKQAIKKFSEVVHNELLSEQENITFLTADGHKFSHPLHHLGKSEEDLPIIAIDSFKHMYLFPKFEDMETPGKLTAFIKDLYSGKLHREFHYGPDSESESEDQPTKPPESAFKNLAPSKNRYTLLKDEL